MIAIGTDKTPAMIGGGEMGRRVRDTDWSHTPLGPYPGWPQSLRSALSLVLNIKGPASLYWGQDQWLLYNDAYGEALGNRHPEAFGRPMSEVLIDIAPVLSPQVAEVLRTGEGFSIENLSLPMRRLGCDEKTVWTYSFSSVQGDDGGFAGVLLLATEMTGQKEVERAQKRVQEPDRTRLEAALNVAQLGSYEWRPYAGLIEMDARASAIFGLPGAGVYSDADAFARVAPDHLDRQRAGALGVMGIKRSFDPSDHAKDVSARVQMEAELLQTQAQKMEAVGQLTGGLAHDFNNLLTGMMGNMELLQLRVARGRLDDLERFILAAQGAGRRAASLTQRLLAFSRRQTLDPKPTDVNRLAAGMEDLLRRTVGPANEIEIIGAAGLWTANIDAGQLENALLNLCINARDAMPDGGRITIETANKWLDERAARERDLSPGQYLSVCVTDTGTGMPPEVIDRVFEPFFTTKPLGEGTGLGLSMIYGFARQSNGQVRIYSEVGTGTTVCVYLPRHLGDAAASEEEEAIAAAATATGETILVVDEARRLRPA